MYISGDHNWTPYGTDPKLDKLVNSDNWEIRRDAAKQGYGLDKLINDENKWVRAAVAEQGYGLDKLVNDKNPYVCIAVAEQGYGLDKLIYDENWSVREAVLKQGYGLDKLIDDEDNDVCYEVYKYLEDNGYKSIFDWADANPNKVVTNLDIDEWFNSDNEYKRAEVAKYGYGLDELVYDEDEEVRAAVATQGYGLDKLINDDDYEVRAAVARQGYGLDKLINDEDYDVLEAVAKQGYGLDKLVVDEDENVREYVWDYLKCKGYKSISDWAKKNSNKVYYKKNVVDDIIDTEFIYNVDDSTKLKVETDYNSIEDFFDDYYLDDGTLTILTANTKIPLMRLEKTTKDGKTYYKFISDINTENDANVFNVTTVLKSKAKLGQLIRLMIDALREYSQFSEYADDLENCL